MESPEDKSFLEKVSGIPRVVLYLILAGTEAYIIAAYFPQFADDYSLRGLLLRLFAVQWGLYLFWSVFLYPQFFSPLSSLPRPKDWITADGVLFHSPRGIDCLRWMKEVPNDGLIRTRAYDGEEFLLITSPEVFAQVLVHKTYDFAKPWLVRKFLSRILGWGLIAAEGEMHKAQRKSLMPAFQLKNIRDLYPLMWDKSMLLTDMLEKKVRGDLADSKMSDHGLITGDIEISSWTSKLTLDIIGPAAMGRDFQSLQHGENLIAENYLELLQPNLRRLLFFALALITPPWVSENWPSPVNASIKRTMRSIRGVCYDIIRQKKQELSAETEQTAQKDILSVMLRGKDMPDDVLVDQMLTFLAAGHETTANALAWTCYLLSKHSHYQTALREELRGAVSDPRDPNSAAELENLPLLNGICNEVFRLYPTVPITVRQPVKDVVVTNHRIPKGTWMMLCPYATNRDPKLWGPQAEAFKPERWIDVVEADEKLPPSIDGVKRAKRQRPNTHGGTSTNFALLTFLHGPRSCIGQGFARAELRCAVAALVGRFDVRLQRPDEEIVSVGAVTPKPKNGIHLKLSILRDWSLDP